jgi:alpha-L-fucosidase
MKEIIDLYQPDLLYSDGPLPFGTHDVSMTGDVCYETGLNAVAHLYNTSIDKYGENRAVFNQKDRRPEIYHIGVLDVEKSQLPGINSDPWQTDTCTGNWFYDVRQEFKKPGHIIEMLIDIISKNGTMLLNVLQRPDGSLDEETIYILEELASWFKVCSEAVYDTRPWRIFGEGDSRVVINGFQESKVEWNNSDFRFTKKGNTLYAFILKAPENRVAVIKSLAEQEKVASVKLLGGDKLPFVQSFGALTIKLPEALPTCYTNCLAIEFDYGQK